MSITSGSAAQSSVMDDFATPPAYFYIIFLFPKHSLIISLELLNSLVC